jgi:TonB family protein
MLVSQPSFAAASVGQPLQPITPWNLDYGETQCVAMRDYSVKSDPVTFIIRPAPNGETYELLVARRRSGPFFAEEREGSVDFGPGPIKAWLLHYQPRKSKLAIDQFRISAAEMAQARTAAGVRLHMKGLSDFSFSLSNMPALISGLDECTADLKRYWNLDGRGTGKPAEPPKGDVRGVFTADDYPSEALNRGQQGTAQFLLLIDEKGGVAACHVLKASGVPALDGMGCAVIRERAKFKPARDSTGKPIRSSTVTPPVSWRLRGT